MVNSFDNKYVRSNKITEKEILLRKLSSYGLDVTKYYHQPNSLLLELLNECREQAMREIHEFNIRNLRDFNIAKIEEKMNKHNELKVSSSDTSFSHDVTPDKELRDLKQTVATLQETVNQLTLLVSKMEKLSSPQTTDNTPIQVGEPSKVKVLWGRTRHTKSL